MLSSPALKRWLQFIFAVAISVVFSFLFISSVDLDEVGDALVDANYIYVAPALALFAVSVCFRALRWRYFLLPEHDLTWRQLMPSVLIGYAGNNLLPLRAGELVRAQHLSDRFAVPRMQTFGALLVERLFDAIVLAAFLLWGLLLVDIGSAYLGLGIALAVAAVAGFVICTAIAQRPGIPASIARLPVPMPDRVRREIAGLGTSFIVGFSVLKSWSQMLAAAGCSATAWGLELGMYWFIAQAFDMGASLETIAFAGAAANVSLSIPSAQGGVGPFESFTTEALKKFGIGAGVSGAYALALHFFLIVPVSLIGLIVLWRAALPGAHEAARNGTAASATRSDVEAT